MATYKTYKDYCVLCHRQLIGNATKSYKPAWVLRKVLPDFKGENVLGHESGGFICRSRLKCNQELWDKLKSFEVAFPT